MNDIAEGTTTVPAADAPERFAEILERAAGDKERVVLTRAGKPVAALVPIEDLEWLEAIEDRLDAEEYRAAKEEFERDGRRTIPLE
jgi:prevent-host-death family protein